jgi:tricarballylate dehydrogenase
MDGKSGNGVLQTERYDVAVVGGGSAAFSAAVSAKIHGATRVVVLEKAPFAQSGGNARYSWTGFRFVNEGAEELRVFLPHLSEEEFRSVHLPPYSAESYHSDLQRLTKNRMNKELAETLVSESNGALHWLREIGHEFEQMTNAVVDGIQYVSTGKPLRSRGGGIMQLERWRKMAERMGIEIRYESRVSEIYGDNRGVDGVRVSGPDGAYNLKIHALILCAGGFQASAQKRAQYLGANADLMKVRGSRHDTGEILEMAIGLGAKPAGQWRGAHASPIDLNAADFECGDNYSRYSYPLSITVNSDGLRFFDEGEDESTYTYAKTGWKLLSQPDAIGYQLFDRKTVPFLRKIYGETASPIAADSIRELADKLGIQPVVLENTVEQFNAHVDESKEFTFPALDGKSTAKLTPEKSNWAVKLDDPPYLAYEVTCGITFTYGGLAIDSHARVLNTSGNPIEGLYASGDILGLFYHNYPSCTGQTRNAVFGRIAGAHAASRVAQM